MAAIKPNSQTDNHQQTEHPIVGDRVIKGDGTSKEAWFNWQGLQNLPSIDLIQNFPSDQRICIFAPHPDDEILGSGGLLQQLAKNGNEILLIHVTNGTQSHPNSQLYPPHKLNDIRPNESQKALQVLGIAQQINTVSLELTDGEVFNQQELFNQEIDTIVKPDDILITPFVHDGHPDHEATGQVVAAYAKRHNLPCYQVLIWAWHWATPADKRIAWKRAVRVDLTEAQQQRKVKAINCFKSQITVDDSTGNPPILSAQTIARICQPWEVYLYER